MSFPTQMEIAAGLIIVFLFIIAGLLYDAVMALGRIEDKLGKLDALQEQVRRPSD